MDRAHADSGMPTDQQAVVLLEGVSDIAAVRVLAQAAHVDLTRVALVDLGGVTNIGRALAELHDGSPDAQVLGLCDAGEVRFVERALTRTGSPVRDATDLPAYGFFVCHADLEEELIRALGATRAVETIRALGLGPKFAALQQQPAWDRPAADRAASSLLRRGVRPQGAARCGPHGRPRTRRGAGAAPSAGRADGRRDRTCLTHAPASRPMLSRMPSDALVSVDTTADYIRLAIVLAALTGLAALVSRIGELGYSRAQITAAARATLQLAIVGAIIASVLASWWLTLAFTAVMVTVASVTAGRRVAGDGAWWWAFLPVCAGALPVAAVLLGTGLVPLKEISVVPVVGILVGGAMTATSLAGKRVRTALAERHGEVEAALSIGLLDRDARLLVAREDAGLALVPGLDQTRTVGLVTLPGAFVGMLLGGATPLQAAAVQLVVLIALLLVAVVATVITMELVARGRMGAPTRGA